MLATALTAAVLGVEAHLIRVEADTASGFPRFTMLGLPDSAIRESEGRIRSALRNCGVAFKWDRRITVNMAPARLPRTARMVSGWNPASHAISVSNQCSSRTRITAPAMARAG